MFFSENWKFAGTPGFQGVTRDHTTATIIDGMSNTILLVENVRTGYDPGSTGGQLGNRLGRSDSNLF